MADNENIKNPTTSSADGGLDLDIDLSGVEEVVEEERSAEEIDAELGVNEDENKDVDIPTVDDEEEDEDPKKKKKGLKKKSVQMRTDESQSYSYDQNNSYSNDPNNIPYSYDPNNIQPETTNIQPEIPNIQPEQPIINVPPIIEDVQPVNPAEPVVTQDITYEQVQDNSFIPGQPDFNPEQADIGHINEVDIHDTSFTTVQGIDIADQPVSPIDNAVKPAETIISDTEQVNSGVQPYTEPIQPTAEAQVTPVSYDSAPVDDKVVSAENGFFGGEQFESFGGEDPYAGANVKVNPVDNSAVQMQAGQEVEGDSNTNHFDKPVDFTNPASSPVMQDIYRSAGSSVLPEATYVGATVIPTPANSTIDTYKETMQPTWSSMSPDVSDIGHTNPMQEHVANSVQEHMPLNEINNSNAYVKTEDGKVTFQKIDPAKQEKTTDDIAVSEQAKTVSAGSASSAQPVQVAPIDNSSFHMGQYDKAAPLQQGTGSPSVVNSHINNATKQDMNTAHSMQSSSTTRQDVNATNSTQTSTPDSVKTVHGFTGGSTGKSIAPDSSSSEVSGTSDGGTKSPAKEAGGSSVVDKIDKASDGANSSGGSGSKGPGPASNAEKSNIKEEQQKTTLEKETAIKYTQKGSKLGTLDKPGEAATQPIKEAFKDDKDDDKSTSDQKHDVDTVKQVTKTFGDVYEAATGALGLTAGASMANYKAESVANATTKFAKTDIATSTLMGDKADLKSALNQAVKDGKLTKAEANSIFRNREYIHDNCIAESEIRSIWEKQRGGINERQATIITDHKIFDNRFAKEYSNAMADYFKNSNNAMLQKFNPMTMRLDELKKFYKKNKAHLGKYDQAMIRKRIKDLQGINARPSKMSLSEIRSDLKLKNIITGRSQIAGRIKGFGRRILSFATRVQDPTFQAINKVMHYSNMIKTAVPLLSLALAGNKKVVKFVGRQIGKTPIGKAAGRAIQTVKDTKASAVNKVKASAKEKIASSKPAKGLSRLRKHAFNTKQSVTGAIKATPIAQKVSTGLNTVQGSINTASQTIGAVKGAIGASKAGQAAKTAKKVTKKAANVVTAPIKALDSLSKTIKVAIQKIKKYIYIAIAIFLLVYLVAVVLMGLLAVLMQSGGKAVEMNGTMIMADVDNISGWIDALNAKDKEKYEEAMEIAKGTPISQDVYYNQKIYHYGSPQSDELEEREIAKMYHNNIPGSETTNGYHIYYLDSAGRIVGQDTTNVKDIISLSTVMFNNDFYDNNGDMNSEEFNALLEKWYELLNPELYYVESDIYHTEFSTDRFMFEGQTDNGLKYYCTDESFYDQYHIAVADGVEFYEEPHEQTEKGCEIDWDQYYADLDEWRSNEPDYSDFEPDDDGVEYTEEEWDERNDAVQDAYDEAYDEWWGEQPNIDDYYYCPGHFSAYFDERNVDPESGMTPGLKCSYGYRDINIYVTVLNKEDVYDAVNGGGNVIKYLVPANYECTEWVEKEVDITIPAVEPEYLYERNTREFYRTGGWTDIEGEDNPEVSEVMKGNVAFDNCDWCNSIFDQDWYGLYGVDVYSYSVSLSDGSGSLSDLEISELMEGVDASERRTAFVSYALEAVGRIPYYWGGKADYQGYDGNRFGTRTTADYKGRNLKGLDCSGFVGWVYWTLFDIKPAAGTANITRSLHMERISFDQLQPGDFGLQALPGAQSNHIGIFVKFDEDTGRAIWVHENSSDSNVGVNNTNCFKYYYRFR